MVELVNYLSSNKSGGENINATAEISSKKASNKKVSSSSIKFDTNQIKKVILNLIEITFE